MRRIFSTTTCTLVLVVIAFLTLALLQNGAAATEQQQEDQDQQDEDQSEEPKIDPVAVRDAIASVLREGSTDEAAAGGGSDGYTDAAQEYLEHVQTVMADVKSTSEVYVRDQLSDLDTLDAILSALELLASKRQRPDRLLPAGAGARLAAHLMKGPARQLLGGSLADFPAAYAGSELASRLSRAAAELRSFLAATSASLTEDLKRHAEGVQPGPVRDYLDALVDRVLRLEGKQVKVSVDWPEEGEPQISPAPDSDDDEAESSTSSSASQSEADPDEGGRRLFDQVLSRRAVASVAARLTEAGKEAAAARIGELRRRVYQPAGMEAMLEAIEQALAD